MVFFTFSKFFLYTPPEDPTLTYGYRPGYAGEVPDACAIAATEAQAGHASGVTIEFEDEDEGDTPEGE